MPSDVVTIAVSTGIGVSVIAGVLSGVCYVLVQGFTRKRSRKSSLQWYCAVCGNYLRPSINEQKIKIVICSECEERVCKKRCSKKDYARREWICYTCLKRPSMLQNIRNAFCLPYKNFTWTNNMVSKQSGQSENKLENTELLSKQEKERVRDFIEKLVSTIVGGSVDEASIFRIYSDKRYDSFFDKFHRDLSEAITSLSSALQISTKNASFSEQTPSSAHTNLKLLIEKILREATRLPRFRKAANNSTSEERTYEDLLATAILNKIINKQENNLSWSSEPSTSDDTISKQNHLEGTTEESIWRELESTSVSSLDEYLYSDSSHGSSKYIDRISLTIKQRIEEIPSKKEHEDEDDEVDYLYENHSSVLTDDQHNWYLQKPQIYETNSPVPVPMLVPNSLTSAKVLIGDKEVDETSDLSDANSEEADVNTQVQDLIVDSSLLYEETSKNYLSDEETSFDSGVREDRDDYNEREMYDTKPENYDSEKVSLISTFSLEKDSEYLEKISSLPTTLYRRPMTNSQQVSSSLELQQPDVVNQVKREPIYDSGVNRTPVFQGSYSQKEKEKWNNPVPIPYNPYSTENIQKRIETNERYGRDYYTRQAGLPSGRAKSDESESIPWTPDDTVFYRAEPIATTDDFDTQSSENYTEITQAIPHWNVNDQQNPEDSFDLSIIQCYNVQNSKIYYESSQDGNKKLEILVNKKEAISPELVDFTTQPNANSDSDFNQNEIKQPTVILNENMEKEDIKKEDEDVVSANNASSNLISTKRTNEENQTSKEAFIAENQKDNRNLFVSTKKSDNTWIKKIYSNPVVRNFALTTREQVPWIMDDESGKTKNNPQKTEAINTKTSPITTNNVVDTTTDNFEIAQSDLERETNNFEKEELPPVHNFSLEFSDTESSREENSTTYDNEFNELKERRLVANRLGEFSKSFPNLIRSRLVSTHQRTEVAKTLSSQDVEYEEVESTETYERLISVKDLKKLFEKNEVVQQNKNKPVHSLTARSISKEIKQKLSSYDNK